MLDRKIYHFNNFPSFCQFCKIVVIPLSENGDVIETQTIERFVPQSFLANSVPACINSSTGGWRQIVNRAFSLLPNYLMCCDKVINFSYQPTSLQKKEILFLHKAWRPLPQKILIIHRTRCVAPVSFAFQPLALYSLIHGRSQGGAKGAIPPKMFRKYSLFVLSETFFKTK